MNNDKIKERIKNTKYHAWLHYKMSELYMKEKF